MKYLFALFSALLFTLPVSAQEASPDVLIKNVTNEVLDIVRKDKEIQSGNTKKAMELIEAKVLPHFNFTRMTQLALARDWRQANPSQQKVLTDEFRALLVRTYSKAITEYKNQTIDFRPLAPSPVKPMSGSVPRSSSQVPARISNSTTISKSPELPGRFMTLRLAVSALSPTTENLLPPRCATMASMAW
jgi:hypothetical protein